MLLWYNASNNVLVLFFSFLCNCLNPEFNYLSFYGKIRVEDAIEILEYVLKLREEKLGIANPDFEDEKSRLAELLKEAGRSRNRKAKSLENLIDPNSRRTKKEGTKRWGFRI